MAFFMWKLRDLAAFALTSCKCGLDEGGWLSLHFFWMYSRNILGRGVRDGWGLTIDGVILCLACDIAARVCCLLHETAALVCAPQAFWVVWAIVALTLFK